MFCKHNSLKCNFVEYKFLSVSNDAIQWFKCKTIKSQLDKFKSAIKNESEVVLRFSSSIIGDNETHFLHQLLLTNGQVANICK